MRILKNYLYNFSFQIFLILVPTVTLPYITRVLGPVALGINTYTYSITYYFTLLAVLGITTYAQREIAYVRNDESKLKILFWEIETISIITTVVAYALMAIVILFLNKYSNFLWIYSLIVLANIFDISWFIVGLEKFSVLVLRNFVVKIVSLILIFTCVRSSGDLSIYIYINAMSVLVSNILLIPYARKMGIPPSLKEMNLKRHIKGMIFLFIPQISISLYTVLSKVTLGAMGQIEGASFFDSADKIVRLIFTILSSLSTVLMPLISNELSQNNLKNVKKIIIISLEFSLFISVGMFFGIFSISETFVPLFLGNNFKPVVFMLQCQSLILIPMSIANVIGNQYLIPNRKEKTLTISILAGSAVSIIINIPGIHYFGAIGASFTIIIAELLVTYLQIILSRKELQYSGLWKETAKYIIAGLTMAILIHFLSFYVSGWLFVVSSIILGALAYVIVCLLLRIALISQIRLLLKGRSLFGKTF
ncbi:MAG: oligosaccharide flippase family protein [Thomasclavelia spiroformis]